MNHLVFHNIQTGVPGSAWMYVTKKLAICNFIWVLFYLLAWGKSTGAGTRVHGVGDRLRLSYPGEGMQAIEEFRLHRLDSIGYCFLRRAEPAKHFHGEESVLTDCPIPLPDKVSGRVHY